MGFILVLQTQVNNEVINLQRPSLALKILSDNPEQPSAKQLVLKIGRYHFGKMRKGAVTIYDEQVIQNDIQVRLK